MWIVVILGIIIGFAGVIFNKGLLNIHYFYDLPVFRNQYMRIAFALCMAGVLGYVFPEVLGGGNDLVNSLYTLPLSLKLFAGLLIGKFLFTLVSYGCGVPGGFFLPMLVLGALTAALRASSSCSWASSLRITYLTSSSSPWLLFLRPRYNHRLRERFSSWK